MNTVTCFEPSCSRAAAAKGLCRRHYKLAWCRARRAALPPRLPALSLADRLERYTVRDGGLVAGLDSPCWRWTGAKHEFGYGLLNSGGPKARVLRAHRLRYEMHVGAIPDGMLVLHRCDNPECSNPEHLFLGTNADNMRDMGDKARSKFHKARFRGIEHGMAKLTDDVVRSIRADRAQGCTYDALAARYSISRSLACQVALRRIWKHVE